MSLLQSAFLIFQLQPEVARFKLSRSTNLTFVFQVPLHTRRSQGRLHLWSCWTVTSDPKSQTCHQPVTAPTDVPHKRLLLQLLTYISFLLLFVYSFVLVIVFVSNEQSACSCKVSLLGVLNVYLCSSDFFERGILVQLCRIRMFPVLFIQKWYLLRGNNVIMYFSRLAL